MKANMGSADRIIRVLVALAVITLVATGTLSGIWSVVGLVLAGVFLLTSLVRFCPLYLPFGIRTNRVRKSA
ncbi:DUF2892 domain-containing protein [Rudanella paleaurantiibacter]|uniref:DUF2892 domain-containing protein n=1 Tax=Rudanella paleaurantiibacter TaxID=2614655 RepID=A0A7J5TY43_9BACT|nr:DUF2892 domain-containing protein [Rudanella paleaurantiibacter]KAB7729991.1 DUF2892 domain-containing protein [Rudanella paleaurantiibacter]